MRTATIQIRKDDASVLREAGVAFVDAGKPKRLVLNAIARKIVVLANAMLRPNPKPA